MKAAFRKLFRSTGRDKVAAVVADNEMDGMSNSNNNNNNNNNNNATGSPRRIKW